MQCLRMMSLGSAVVFLMLAALPAAAEQVGPAPKDTSSWLSVIFAIVLCVGIGVGSFINPKRGHQD